MNMTKENVKKMGSKGECICPKCEKHVTHQRGIPCQDERCPNCHSKMLRVGSLHYELWIKKRRAL